MAALSGGGGGGFELTEADRAPLREVELVLGADLLYDTASTVALVRLLPEILAGCPPAVRCAPSHSSRFRAFLRASSRF